MRSRGSATSTRDETAAGICAYVVLVNTIELASEPLQKTGLLCLFLLLLLARRPLASPAIQGRLPLLVPALAAIPLAAALAAVGTIHPVQILGGAMASLLILTFLPGLPRHLPRPLSPEGLRWLACLTILAGVLASALLAAAPTDVATTTRVAARTLAAGRSPYADVIDLSGAIVTGSDRFLGYKYGPLCIVAYAPFLAAFGPRGLFIANALGLASTAILLRALAGRLGVARPAWIAGLLLAGPFLGAQVLKYRVNDLLATLPVCLAFLVWRRRPGLAGLLLGASMSIKFAPAPLAMLMLIPHGPSAMRRYLLGIAAGLLPIVLIAALDVTAAFDNLVLFNLARPPRDSWLVLAPPMVATAVKAMFAIAVLAAGGLVWRQDWPMPRRMQAYTVMAIGLLLCSGLAMTNYWLWWLPLFPLLLAAPPDSGTA